MPLRIAIIGMGRIGHVHLKSVADHSQAKVVSIVDLTPQHLPGITQYADWREAVESVEVDAAVICLPHVLHRECAEAALRKGKHVFLEKPLANTLADAECLVQCAREEQRRLMVNMPHRFSSPAAACKGAAGGWRHWQSQLRSPSVRPSSRSF